MTDKFKVVVTGLVTNQGEILAGKKKEKEGHPVSGEWHLPSISLEEEEEIRKKVKEGIREETGLKADVHQLIDTYYDAEVEVVRTVFHCESDSKDAEPKEDLTDVKWIDPSDIEGELGETENEMLLERKEVEKFLEKLQQMPVF